MDLEFKAEPLEKVEELELQLKQVTAEKPTALPADLLEVPTRELLFSENVEQESDFASDYDDDFDGEEVTSEEIANLTISRTSSGNHAPVIDFDIPVECYPSSQLGHSHLYINKEISWEDFQKLLHVLVEVKLIEPGYAEASKNAGYSAVRTVGHQKVDAPKGAAVLKENAEFRKLIYDLRRDLEYWIAKSNEEVDWEIVEERNGLAATATELFETNQHLVNEVNQLKEEVNRLRLEQMQSANTSWA